MSEMKRNAIPTSAAKPISVPIPYDRMPIMSIGLPPRPAMIGQKTESGLQLANDVVNLGGVMLGVDAIGGVADDALLVDHEGRAHQAFLAHAVGFLSLQHAVAPADLALGIGEQAKREAMPVAEFGVREAIIARDAENNAVAAPELFLV